MDVRTFISIPVPNTAGLEPLVRDLKTVRGVKVSPVKNIHITLKFLGDVPEERLEEVDAIVKDAVRGVKPGRITVKGFGAFPNTRNPRVLWAGLDTDLPLAEISERIGKGLSRVGLPYDEKPFKPHITVGRVDGKAELTNMFGKYKTTEFTTFVCPSVMVMKSELRPTGAVHTIQEVCYLQ